MLLSRIQFVQLDIFEKSDLKLVRHKKRNLASRSPFIKFCNHTLATNYQ
jgi:hypothetical protein